MISDRVDEQHPATKSPRTELQYGVGVRPRKSHWWVWLIVIAVVGVAAYFAVPRLIGAFTATGSTAQSAASRVVPVVSATARKGEMNIYLTGLGTVTAFNTVAVRSRVDGQITKVYFAEGQIVKKDDPLVEVDPRPFEAQLKEAQGQLARDQALKENAQRDLERYQSIRSSVTQQQIDTQAALVKQYEGAVEVDQGQIESAKLQITYSHITAPLSGRIGLRLVDEGNIVHASDTTALAVITQLQPISVLFTLPEDQISQVFARPDHGQGLEIDAYNRDMTQVIATGSLLAIDNQVDPTTGTVRLKGEFQNEDAALFPNEFVNARLLVNTLRGVVIVPAAAVQRGPNDSTFVYVVRPDNTVELHDVVVGPTEGDQTVIEKGVTPGEVVVTDGVDKLQQGTKVAPHERPAMAAATRPAGRPTTRPTSRPATMQSIEGARPNGQTTARPTDRTTGGRGGR